MRRWNGKRKWWLRRGSQVRTGGGAFLALLGIDIDAPDAVEVPVP